MKFLINLIDNIISSSYEIKNDKRLFTKTQIKSKLTEQNEACAICKNSKEKYAGDHIIPWSKGGKTDYENLQVLCNIFFKKRCGYFIVNFNLL